MRDIFRLTPRQSLTILFWLRNSAMAGQALAIALVHFGLGLALPLAPLAVTIVLLACLNLFTCWRLRRGDHASLREVLAHLCLDATALTALLFFTGGPNNPFISLYLIPIALAAVVLPRLFVWVVAGLCSGFYIFLMFYYVPMPRDILVGMLNLHVLGTWVNFMLSAVLITVFVGSMASAIRRSERELSAATEQTLRNEQIVALGTLAAGAAHQLGTPLSTMAVVVNELRLHPPASVLEIQADIAVLDSQIAVCKSTLSELLAAAGHGRAEAGKGMGLRQFLAQALDNWSLMRPDVEAVVRWEGSSQVNPLIMSEQTLAQALINLLNNAADASLENNSRTVQVWLSCDPECLTVTIDDEGPGLGGQDQRELSRLAFTTKPEGFGLGLGLSHATLSRFGGRVVLQNRAGVGARTTVTLPLSVLLIDSPGLVAESLDRA